MPGRWDPLISTPSFNVGTMLLLTDGTVMCQDNGVNGTPNWWRLTPDAQGSYRNGTWSQLASGPNSPLYYASAVLKDGRVFLAGGEYNGSSQAVDLLAAEIYDPVADRWSSISTPDGWQHIGDAPSCVLPDGRVLLGSIDDTKTAVYDPAANSWTAAANKGDSSSEETFALLPDGTILSVQCSASPNAEKYIISSDKWVSAGKTSAPLPQVCPESPVGEIGPAILLPDGRVYAIGASGNTSIYVPPSTAKQTGDWLAGPMLKDSSGNTLYPMDAPACLLPNGKVLLCASPAPPCSYPGPTTFFEYDPSSNVVLLIARPDSAGNACYQARLLLLPTGQVLFANGSTDVRIYTPEGGPLPAWKPVIINVPTNVNANQTYLAEGRQLNGLSQAVSYGDDAQMATNYPLVCLQNVTTKQITFCRTFDHSTMAVATGAATHSTHFLVPPNVPLGPSDLIVIANGIWSAPVRVTVNQ